MVIRLTHFFAWVFRQISILTFSNVMHPHFHFLNQTNVNGQFEVSVLNGLLGKMANACKGSFEAASGL